MSNVVSFILALLIGIGMGLIYFGGLWLTVRKLPNTSNPVLLSIVSFFGRVGFVGTGFYLLMVKAQYAPIHLLACLLTFFGIRNLLVQRLKPNKASC
ncbi:MAG TPA: ATP synthase subunit I [Cyanobacteria bacterium UBA11369]|nr:ATP synthase subunit I [Cyanobacteria bacterium UBA11368]HBE54072.1 ATP synthase subunit I [Cyanobacteria bacterium UBA11369]